jgi:Beta-propeller repeat
MKIMKTGLIVIFLIIGMVSNVFAQKIDFSIYLVSGEEVHSLPKPSVDRNGNIFIVGGTRSGLKVSDDAFQKQYQGHSNWVGGDLYLMKLSPKGELLYSSYIGGAGNDAYCGQLAFDEKDNVYIAFSTDSKGMPVSKNAYQKYNKGEGDFFIMKFSNDCRYISATYLGGTGGDFGADLYIYNNVLYLIGGTKSNDFPVTNGAFQKKFHKWIGKKPAQGWMVRDIIITALSLNLDEVIYSTYFGGSHYDNALSIVFDKNGNIAIAGCTKSENFPISSNAYNDSINGEMDGFVSILKSDLSEMIYSSFIGGSKDDNVWSMVNYNENHVILAGRTKSSDFPVTPDALNGKYLGGMEDGFVAKLNIKTNKLAYSSFMGGSGSDLFLYGAKTDDQKYLFLGRTSSKDIPVTENAISQTFQGGKDILLTILDKSLKKIEYATYIGGSRDDAWQVAPNAKYIKGNKLLIFTDTSSPDFPLTKTIARFPSFQKDCLMKIDLNSK